MDIATILSSGVIAGVVAGFVTLRTSERNISIENITKQRQVWRNTIRALAINISSAYLRNERYKIKSYYIELQFLLNPNDDDDREILDTVWEMQEKKQMENLEIEFSEKISLLLKHDWERAKLEARSPLIRIISVFRISYGAFKNKRISRIESIKDSTVNEGLNSISLNEKLKKRFFDDPKPLFDYVRNIGILSVLTVGAYTLHTFNGDNYPPLFAYLMPMFSSILYFIASLLLINSVLFARKSISLFFFGKEKLDGVFSNACFFMIWALYFMAFSAIIFISISSAINSKPQVTNVQYSEMNLNLDKVKQSFDKLQKENIRLNNEVAQLKKNIK
ncbi:hypothetical protein ACEUBW_06700 [Aeromonas veronii]|uniref:hypothetical protein n=1 Tax=Aeromonas veronii TaxID=654 RepID=UPI001D069689|nr:hypothetical protein [Aeromonas veronii]